MRFNTNNQTYFKFLKKINFGGLKSIFFVLSLLYFCIYFFENIDQISFDINLERNGIYLSLSFLFCIVSIYLNAYALKYIVKWFGKEFKSSNLVSFYVLILISKPHHFLVSYLLIHRVSKFVLLLYFQKSLNTPLFV